jgi:hypothetical protein
MGLGPPRGVERRIGSVDQPEQAEAHPAQQVEVRVHRRELEVMGSPHGDAHPDPHDQAQDGEQDERDVDSRHIYPL